MSILSVRWPNVLAAYFALTLTLAVVGWFLPQPWHRVLLVAAVLLMGGFVPGVMLVYFLRGVRGNV